MADNLEKILKSVYQKWEEGHSAPAGGHPDEEALADFLEQGLPASEYEKTLVHLAACRDCLEKIALRIRSNGAPQISPPAELIQRLKEVFLRQDAGQPLEIVLGVKGRLLELVKTTGDVLFGQELLPAPVLRSRRIKDFKDEVTILKDFPGIRVEIKVEHKADASFNVRVSVKDQKTALPLKDFRATLMQAETELESYVSSTGTVIFEHIALGRYAIIVANLQEKLASVTIEINK
jgi:hypothetical protein